MSKTIKIKLGLGEILFDIQNKTYFAGKTREADDRIKATIQASSDDNTQMFRAIQNAVDRVTIALSDYITGSNSSFSNTCFASGGATEQISLTVPSNFNSGMGKSIATMIHSYIVDCALRDWFTLVFKADAADYVQLSNVTIQDIVSAISKRTAPTRS